MSTIREELSETTELIGYVCGDCSSKLWLIRIGKNASGRTDLIITCGNKECVERRRKELGAGPDELLIWDSFDISDSSYGSWDKISSGDVVN